jgi:sugar-specific transcriptional regulator TrmB
MDRAAIAKRLEEIAALHGGSLTADLVVQDAKNPESPLHAYFDWDKDSASYKHWIDTARSLIASVRVVITTEKVVIKAPFYLRDPSKKGNEQGYTMLTKVRSDRSMAAEVINHEVALIIAALRRAKNVAQALDMVDEMENLLTQVLALRSKVET